MTSDDLATQRAVLQVADSNPGFPCRISLEDAQPGTLVALVNYERLPLDSPYRASHAIYVSVTATRPFDERNVVPPALRRRYLSVRAYDARGMMVDADVAEGAALEPLVERLFASPEVEYLHAHTARRGCFLAQIRRG